MLYQVDGGGRFGHCQLHAFVNRWNYLTKFVEHVSKGFQTCLEIVHSISVLSSLFELLRGVRHVDEGALPLMSYCAIKKVGHVHKT